MVSLILGPRYSIHLDNRPGLERHGTPHPGEFNMVRTLHIMQYDSITMYGSNTTQLNSRKSMTLTPQKNMKASGPAEGEGISVGLM